MKTFVKPLFTLFAVSVLSISAALANTNPGTRPASVATFKTGIYTTADGKLQIGLEKETTGAVDIKLKNAAGKVLFTKHLSKHEAGTKMRLNLNELEDGAYQLEITNGVETTTRTINVATQQPVAPSRVIALN